ncbi:hypothetical protein [Nonomuraea sp. 10N515B]|uniref:hypothetical protein n=1 Tax=Nonomuraea sp. 10N515B TaxID=3457422 RepID=UPI003FCEA9A2
MSRSARTSGLRLEPPTTEVTAFRQPVRSTASFSMSISGTEPQRRLTSFLIRRRFRGSSAGPSFVSLIAPDLRSEIANQSSFGSAVSNASSSARISALNSAMKSFGSSGLRSSA